MVFRLRNIDRVVVQNGVELLERPLIGAVVLITDELRTNLESLRGGARHGSRDIVGADEDLVLAGLNHGSACTLTCHHIVGLLSHGEGVLHKGVLLVNGEVLDHALLAVLVGVSLNHRFNRVYVGKNNCL